MREGLQQAILLKANKTAVIMGFGLLQIFLRGMLQDPSASHHSKQKSQP